MKRLLAMALALASTSCVTVRPGGQTSETTPGTVVIARTNVDCKATAGGVSKSCSYAKGNCESLAGDMKECCGSAEYVSSATCMEN